MSDSQFSTPTSSKFPIFLSVFSPFKSSNQSKHFSSMNMASSWLESTHSEMRNSWHLSMSVCQMNVMHIALVRKLWCVFVCSISVHKFNQYGLIRLFSVIIEDRIELIGNSMHENEMVQHFLMRMLLLLLFDLLLLIRIIHTCSNLCSVHIIHRWIIIFARPE